MQLKAASFRSLSCREFLLIRSLSFLHRVEDVQASEESSKPDYPRISASRTNSIRHRFLVAARQRARVTLIHSWGMSFEKMAQATAPSFCARATREAYKRKSSL